MTDYKYISFLTSEVRVSKEKMPRNPALTDATNTNSVEEKLIYSAWLSDSPIVDREEDKERLKEKVYISDKDEWPGGDFNKYAPVPSKSYGPFEIEVEVVDEMTDGWVPSYNDPDNRGSQMPSEPTGRKVARLRAEKEKPVQSGFDTLKGRIENSAHSFTEGAEVTNIYTPEQPTLKARVSCAEWLNHCLSIGWEKHQLDALEKIWWEHHDNKGNLVKVEKEETKPEGENAKQIFFDHMESHLIETLGLNIDKFEYNDVRAFCNSVRRIVASPAETER